MGSTFGLAFSISYFFFKILICPGTCKIKGSAFGRTLTIPTWFCHFLMRKYISPCDVYHIPDGHMAQFPALCDYIEQG
jgi:hypothetical protein